MQNKKNNIWNLGYLTQVNRTPTSQKRFEGSSLLTWVRTKLHTCIYRYLRFANSSYGAAETKVALPMIDPCHIVMVKSSLLNIDQVYDWASCTCIVTRAQGVRKSPTPVVLLMFSKNKEEGFWNVEIVQFPFPLRKLEFCALWVDRELCLKLYLVHTLLDSFL